MSNTVQVSVGTVCGCLNSVDDNDEKCGKILPPGGCLEYYKSRNDFPVIRICLRHAIFSMYSLNHKD